MLFKAKNLRKTGTKMGFPLKASNPNQNQSFLCVLRSLGNSHVMPVTVRKYSVVLSVISDIYIYIEEEEGVGVGGEGESAIGHRENGLAYIGVNLGVLNSRLLFSFFLCICFR